MEFCEEQPDPGIMEGCFERTFSALTVDDVYEIAKAIGADVERIIDSCGRENAAGLVPKIVKVLELLESFASRNDAHKLREEELLKTFETLQLQQQKKRVGKEVEESSDKQEIRVRDTRTPGSSKNPVDHVLEAATQATLSLFR